MITCGQLLEMFRMALSEAGFPDAPIFLVAGARPEAEAEPHTGQVMIVTQALTQRFATREEYMPSARPPT